MKIQKTTFDGDPIRKFYLVAEVTFRDSPDGDNYYKDDELRGTAEHWMGAGMGDRDDSPAVRFRALPEILNVDIESVFRGDYPGHSDGE